MKKLLIIFCLAALVCSCEIPFSIKDISEPRFLIECIPTPGDSTVVLVGYADAAYSNKHGAYAFKNSDAEISVNDKVLNTDNLKWEREGNLFHAILRNGFKSGDRVSISVKGAAMPTASASTVVPEEPGISSLSITPTGDKKDTTALRVVLKLSKPVADDDYYGLEITVHQEIYQIEITDEPPFFKRDTILYKYHTTPGQAASMSDINDMDLDAFAQVQYSYGSLINRYFGDSYSYSPMVLLSSRQFDGDTYSFYLNSSFSFFDVFDNMPDDFDYENPDEPEAGEPEDPYYDDDDPYYPEEPEEPEVLIFTIGVKTWYEMEVFRLSEELYNYCKAQYLQEFNLLANFGVTPPNFTYSNVQGGLGAVGGAARGKTERIPDPNNKEPEMPNLADLLKQLTK